MKTRWEMIVCDLTSWNECIRTNYATASWFDHPRDLLHLVNVKRAEMPRPIVGIGHSMGGAHL
jgi:alpha-beta hydrolase superfamily lysophospholipase